MTNAATDNPAPLPAAVAPADRRARMRIATDDDLPVGDHPPADDPAHAHLKVIAVANRVLANRVAELETEMERQAAVAERLRHNLADQACGFLTDAVDAADAAGGSDRRATGTATRASRLATGPVRVLRRLRAVIRGAR